MALSVNITKRLGDFQLRAAFEADQECLALLGASGCGKSVTLQCIAGTMTPDGGRIVLDGVTLFDSEQKINLPPQKRKVGFLFQQYALFPNMTVRQNIAAAAADKKTRDARTAEKLRQFRLEDAAELKPSQLSGGQQQRTALARMLMAEPRILLLDEPLSALDSYLRYRLELELAEELDQFHGTVLWVTHDRGEAFRNCSRICVIDRGISQPVCTTEDLFHAPRTEAAARLSGCKNYANAIPQGSCIRIPEWNLVLDCGREVPDEINRVGIRSHHVVPATQEINAFDCRVIRVISDVFSEIVLLRPAGTEENAPYLRMELKKSAWLEFAGLEILRVSVLPENLLLLSQRKENQNVPGSSCNSK